MASMGLEKSKGFGNGGDKKGYPMMKVGICYFINSLVRKSGSSFKLNLTSILAKLSFDLFKSLFQNVLVAWF